MSNRVLILTLAVITAACGQSQPYGEDSAVTATPEQADSGAEPRSDDVAAGATPRVIPRFATPQNAPCLDQSETITELIQAFDEGAIPQPHEFAASWVAIGFLDSTPSLNCDGVMRAGVFEKVILAGADSVEIDMIGMGSQTRAAVLDDELGLTFHVDFGGDGFPEYRCKLTDRGTLACLSGRGEWVTGWELKRMPFEDHQRASRNRPSR